MANFCLTKEDIARVSAAMKKEGGVSLTKKNFGELEVFFTEALGNEFNAVEMAKGFKLAVISRRKNSLQTWLKQTLTPSEVETYNKRQAETERTQILQEYKTRMAEIRQQHKEKKITDNERAELEKAAVAKRDKPTVSPEKQAEVNIKRLQKRLEDIKQGKQKTREKRDLTEEEKKIHAEIDAELEKAADGMNVITSNIDQAVIEKAMGVSIEPEEVQEIIRLTALIAEAEKLPKDNPFGIPNTEYFKARQALQKYIQEINPSSNLGIITSVIARGNLLFSIKAATVNVVSNTSLLFTEMVARRIVARKFSGVNSDLVKPFVEHAFKVYRETGYDVVRMLKIMDEDRILGEKQTSSEGSGAIRATGRFYEDWIFRGSMGTPDILYAALHFADSLNIYSTKLADSEGLTGDAHKKRARELFLEATALDPQSKLETVALREQAIADALFATFQNDSFVAEKLLEIRQLADDVTGDIKLGTYNEPFVKTVANVVMSGFQYIGVTLPILAFKVKGAVTEYKNGNPTPLREMTTEAVRAGLGLTISFMIVAMLGDDDDEEGTIYYIPEYSLADQEQRRLVKFNNATYNSIKIGDKWVSLEYFGILGAPMAAIASIKSQQGEGSMIVEAFQGLVSQVGRLPIIGKFFDMNQWFQTTKEYATTDKEMYTAAVGDTLSNLYSRTFPMFLSDIGEAADDSKRADDYENAYDQILAKVPFLRETLPAKYNELGEVIPTENVLWSMISGARIKTQNPSAVAAEITRLETTGTSITFDTKNLGAMKAAKEAMSFEEYNEFHALVQHNLTVAFEKFMDSPRYKKMSDLEIKEAVVDARQGIIESTATEQGYYNRINQQIKDEKKREKEEEKAKNEAAQE